MYAITVCAHTNRQEYARDLQTVLGARITFDDGTLGATGNTVQAYKTSYGMGEDWCGVVEDDAIPVDDIHAQLHSCLQVAPTGIVLAYLGTSRPSGKQNAIQQALECDPTWIISDNFLSHVAVFMRRELVPSAVKYLQQPATGGPDSRLTRWAHQVKEPISVSVPSLFDHQDSTPMVEKRAIPLNGEVRRAYKHGGRDGWSGRIQILDRATENRYGKLFQ